MVRGAFFELSWKSEMQQLTEDDERKEFHCLVIEGVGVCTDYKQHQR